MNNNTKQQEITTNIIDNNSLVITYPEDFIQGIEKAFGKDSKEHKLALFGSYKIGTILNDLTDEYISNEALVNAIEGNSLDLHNIYAKTRELNIYDNLWFAWNDIINDALDNLELTNNQINIEESRIE
jgi:aspartokinase-like uncharacterized kinase